jgi:hypothetical protein
MVAVKETFQRPAGLEHHLGAHQLGDRPASTASFDGSAGNHQSLWDSMAQPSQPKVPQASRRGERIHGAVTYPPPASVASQLSIADFVREKEDTFAAAGSAHWIEAFARHPSIVEIEQDGPQSDVYAQRYLAFFEQVEEQDDRQKKSAGHKLMRALESYFRYYPNRFPEGYGKETMVYLRALRKHQVDAIARGKKKQLAGAEGTSPRVQKGHKTKSKEFVMEEALRFLTFLEESGIQYTEMGPKELEEQTREPSTIFYEGDKKRANWDMQQYMRVMKMDGHEIKLASMARSTFNRMHQRKTYNAEYYTKTKRKARTPPSPTSLLQKQFDAASLDPAISRQRCDAMYDELYHVIHADDTSPSSAHQSHGHFAPLQQHPPRYYESAFLPHDVSSSQHHQTHAEYGTPQSTYYQLDTGVASSSSLFPQQTSAQSRNSTEEELYWANVCGYLRSQ